MKKILSFILTLVMVLGICAPAMAYQGDVTATAVYNDEIGAIVVSGTVKSKLSKLFVTLEFKNEEGVVVYVDQILLPSADTLEKPYSFPAISLHPKNKTGNYSVLVTAENVGTAEPITYYFKGSDIQLQALKAVNDAIVAKDEAALSEALISKNEDLGISKKEYLAMLPKAQTSVISAMMQKTYSVPADNSTDENIDIIMKSITKLRSDWQEALKIGAFYNIASTADLKNWIETNGVQFSGDDAETKVDESKLYAYVKDVSSDAAMVRRANELDIKYTIEEIGKSLYEMALLSIIETRHFTESKQIFIEFPDLFGIDLSNFNKLNSDKRAEVYEEVPGNYKSYASAGEAFDDLVTLKLSPGGSSGGSSGGPSGKNYGSTITGPLQTTGQNTQTGNATEAFPDMNEAIWATEAVTALKKKGILNGDENGYLHPNKSITRAEFTKLIVLATGLELENTGADFSDVSEADWYYLYVVTAKKHGLVNGGADNKFSPNDFITREDMAVILYRAYKIDKTLDLNLEFSDKSAISAYAKDAIGFLCAKGIMQGIGNNLFAPKELATKAEASQMLYNALK